MIAVDTNIDAKTSYIDTDFDVEDNSTSENMKRRINWQKGRQDWSQPSKTKREIDKVTVDTLAEVYACMRKNGWAILRDLTSVFAPSARFTREQRNFINKSKSPLQLMVSTTVPGTYKTLCVLNPPMSKQCR